MAAQNVLQLRAPDSLADPHAIPDVHGETERPGRAVLPLAICELTDPSRLPSGVHTHFTLADHDTTAADTLGFSYSHRGFFFDLTFIVLIPWVLVRIKQRHSRSMFQYEENRRDDRRSGTESGRRGGADKTTLLGVESGATRHSRASGV